MRTRLLLAMILLCAYSIPAQAALFDRGGGMIYDDVLDITWLQDANLGGLMNWHDSVAWADKLSHGGFDDWRLASMDVNLDEVIVDCATASELACRDNELGYMFYYNLNGDLFDNLTGNQSMFMNIPFDHWSGTEASLAGWAWVFRFFDGIQNIDLKGNVSSAWAVRSGDVAVVPLPGALWLLGSGVLGLVGLALRRTAGNPLR